MTEIAPVSAQQPQMRILAPTREAFRRVAILAAANRRTLLQSNSQMSQLTGEGMTDLPLAVIPMDIRAVEAQVRGEEILEAIGQYEEHVSTETAEEKLVRYEHMLGLLVHPDVDIAMQQATDALQARGFRGIVIIPGGSGVSGSMLVRELSALVQASGQDIDMTVQYDPNDKPNLGVVNTVIGEAISSVSSAIYPNGNIHFILDTHGIFTPAGSGSPIFSEEDVWDFLMPHVASTVNRSWENLANCFSLTYPAEYGERVRRDVLKTLRELHKVSRQRWQQVIKILIDEITMETVIKRKHITSSTAHAKLIRKVGSELQEVKRAIVEDMLYATAA